MSDRVILKPGATVAVGDRHYSLSQVLDLETILVHDGQSGEMKQLKIDALAPVAPPPEELSPPGEADLVMVADTL